MNKTKDIEHLDVIEQEYLAEVSKIHKEASTYKIEIYFNTANKYKAWGQYSKAIKELETALQIQTENFGEENKKTVNILNELGILHSNKGNYDKAIELHEKALKISVGSYGEEHQDVAVIYNNLGCVYYKKDDYDKAIELYEKALKILRGVVGTSNYYFIECRENLRILMKGMENHDKKT